MFMIVSVVSYNINLYQLCKNIKKIVIIILIHLIGFKFNSFYLKIIKSFKYMVYINVLCISVLPQSVFMKMFFLASYTQYYLSLCKFLACFD